MKHTQPIQVLYEISFCLWLLSFSKDCTTYFHNENIVARLHDILKNKKKEKVIRVVLSTLRNLMKWKTFVNDMVQVGIIKTLMNLDKRNFEDKDIKELLTEMLGTLESRIDEMSSFDEYRQEVLSGHLEWSPVHTSEKFWKESMGKIEENNYAILRQLVKLLDSDDPKTLAIACHDLGQYVQYNPKGKQVLNSIGGKTKVIKFMEHSDEEVKKQALLCVQKIMIQKWEYLQN